MAKLTDIQGATLIKGLVVGDPGTGKTGGLLSLVQAGYKLRIYDFDNLLAPLLTYVNQYCPERIDQIRVQTITDKLKGSVPMMIAGNLVVGSPVEGIPKAYPELLKQLDHWNDGEDLGLPKSWGSGTIVVLDSLTVVAKAAYRYCFAMNPGAKDGRPAYFAAQQLIVNLLDQLAGKDFATNVLVLAHLDYDKDSLGNTKGFPRTIGSAIQTAIADKFNCVLLTETQGSGTSAKRVIRTNSTGIVDLKNPAPFKVKDVLPLETGYADVFKGVHTTGTTNG